MRRPARSRRTSRIRSAGWCSAATVDAAPFLAAARGTIWLSGLLSITGRAPKLSFAWTRDRPEPHPSAPPASKWLTVVAKVRAGRAVTSASARVASRSEDERDATTALVTMGYKPPEARAAVARAIAEVGTLPLDQLVPAALRRCPR